jgi:hypothetical protein
MDLLKTLFHFIMMWFGATIRLENIKYPNLLMLINKVAIIVSLIYLMI